MQLAIGYEGVRVYLEVVSIEPAVALGVVMNRVGWLERERGRLLPI